MSIAKIVTDFYFMHVKNARFILEGNYFYIYHDIIFHSIPLLVATVRKALIYEIIYIYGPYPFELTCNEI